MQTQKKYTYIPKEEIADITTFNNVSFENDDILNGAYVRGRKKFARGGINYGRLVTLEQQAADSVGYETWFSLDSYGQAELVQGLQETGMITEMMAKGGVTESIMEEPIAFVVSWKVGEKSKERKFNNKKEAEDYFDIMSDEDSVYLKSIYPEALEVPKKKSLFDIAKPLPVGAAKKKRERVEIKGIADEIIRYDELKAIINNAKSEQELIGGRIKEIGREKFMDIYEQKGSRPPNFDLADGNENILLEIKDQYIGSTGAGLEPEKVAILEQFDGLLEVLTTYEFNKDVLENEVGEGTVGDIVSQLIQDSNLLSDTDKENLIKVKQVTRVRKGSIDRLMDYENPREVFYLIQPILALK